MAKRSNPASEPIDAAIKSAILDAVESLYEEHHEQINKIVSGSSEKSITVTFGNKIDCSSSEPVIETTIRFCETFTDKRTNKITDPKQGTFETIENAGRGGRKSDDDKDE